MKLFSAFDTSPTAPAHLAPAEQALLTTLEQDWRAVIATPSSPSRLDPRLLDAALPHAFLLERTAPGALRTRVAGQRLHDMLHMDPRGMSFGTFFTDADRQTALNLAETAFTAPAIVGIPLRASRGIGRKSLRAAALLLPLRDSHDDITRVMGALVVSGGSALRGLRFDIASDIPVRCDPINLTFTDRRTYRGKVADHAMTKASLTVQTGPRLVVDNSKA